VRTLLCRRSAVLAGLVLVATLTSCNSGPVAELDAAGVVKKLAEYNLPATLTVTFTTESDPDKLLGRPGGYSSKAAFSDSRISVGETAANDGSIGVGGGVEVFADADAAKERAEWIQPVVEEKPRMLGEYTYVKGPVVLRVSNALIPMDAEAYEAALSKIVRLAG
jgi:hypothetical protein